MRTDKSRFFKISYVIKKNFDINVNLIFRVNNQLSIFTNKTQKICFYSFL